MPRHNKDLWCDLFSYFTSLSRVKPHFLSVRDGSCALSDVMHAWSIYGIRSFVLNFRSNTWVAYHKTAPQSSILPKPQLSIRKIKRRSRIFLPLREKKEGAEMRGNYTYQNISRKGKHAEKTCVDTKDGRFGSYWTSLAMNRTNTRCDFWLSGSVDWHCVGRPEQRGQASPRKSVSSDAEPATDSEPADGPLRQIKYFFSRSVSMILFLDCRVCKLTYESVNYPAHSAKRQRFTLPICQCSIDSFYTTCCYILTDNCTSKPGLQLVCNRCEALLPGIVP